MEEGYGNGNVDVDVNVKRCDGRWRMEDGGRRGLYYLECLVCCRFNRVCCLDYTLQIRDPSQSINMKSRESGRMGLW